MNLERRPKMFHAALFCLAVLAMLAAAVPSIKFTHVPPRLSIAAVTGTVVDTVGLIPSEWAVACYIYQQGWWTKP